MKGTEAQIQAVLDGGILLHLHKLMGHSRPSIVQVSHVRASGVVGRYIERLQDYKWFNVQHVGCHMCGRSMYMYMALTQLLQ